VRVKVKIGRVEVARKEFAELRLLVPRSWMEVEVDEVEKICKKCSYLNCQ
jgi:hypothetical protein